ncbi:MAG: ATP-binding cassette domain-containing protein [Halobacteriota archaeon]
MTAIDIEALTKYYDGTVGIDGLTFSVETGEIFGFLGPNGAGKTTTIRLLLGLLTPTSGSATVLDADTRDEAALVEARRRIGYLPATLGFDGDVRGRRILDYHAAIKGDERLDELLELFTPPLDRKVREYSSGNVQMLGLIQTFMHDPDLVIMDEPTAGLDPLKQASLNAFLRDERERGTTIFFSSHVLSEVRRVCDRVGILRDGHLVALEEIQALLARGGKRVHVQLDGPLADGTFDLDGVIDLRRVGEEVQFTYAGDYDVLLRHLAEQPVRDISITEPPIEDVFIHYYGPDGAVRGASGA